MDNDQQPNNEQLQQLKQLQIQLQQLELQIQLQQQKKKQEGEQEAPEQEAPEKEKEESTQSGSEKKGQTDAVQEARRYYEVPMIISTIDIGHIKELLNSNLLAVKQIRQATQNCQLPDLKHQFDELSQIYLKHYDNLLGFLSENGGNVQ
ncbi:hypothetical protein [Sporosarcina sp. G11-34]|uniref:hypothetical protein n=1 Tax=Sporosarcina sp. G11-34 TaxID=2849605 RepID=UPI0022A9A4DD|nr:hypothetical protein [Sporosarcina sp. G11-34]MCZ2257781.1 hypothetical protein [Sporosarcina sp. G11-34]